MSKRRRDVENQMFLNLDGMDEAQTEGVGGQGSGVRSSRDVAIAEPPEPIKEVAVTPAPKVLPRIDPPTSVEKLTETRRDDPFRLTDDQRKALDLSGNCVLSASAGTGKTHTLTALYLGLLSGRLAPGSALLDEAEWLRSAAAGELRPLMPGAVVAVTFTDRAAGELLARTREAIEALLRQASLPPQLKTHLESCRNELPTAPVCTIHSFCGRLLREAGSRSSAPAGFEVLEEDAAGEMLDRALSDCAAEILESGSDPVFKTLALELGAQSVISECRSLIRQLRAHGKPASALKGEEQGLSLNEAYDELCAYFSEIRSIYDEGRSRRPSDDLMRLCDTHAHPTTFEALRKLALLAHSLSLNPGGSVPAWAKRIDSPIPRILACANVPFVGAIIKYIDRASKRYRDLKRRAGMVDFDDLLLLSDELLQASSEGLDRYAFVLIDEYQDTNPLQDRVLQRVAFAAGAGDSAKLAVVGDIKQSIYRFRGADVTLMEEAERQFRVAPLRDNFRSRSRYIDFVNHFFQRLWPEGAQFVYGENHRLIAPENGERHAWAGPPAELLTRDEESENASSGRWAQARAIARRIRTLVAPAAESVLTRPVIWDRQTNSKRETVRYGDIAILASSLKNIRVPLQIALSDLGIPSRMAKGVSFYARQEIHDVANLLAAVADPGDNLALAGFLRSPLVGASDGGIWRLIVGGGDPDSLPPPDRHELDATRLYERLREAAAGASEDSDRAAFRRAAELLADLRAGAGRRTAAELIARACDSTGFLSILALQPQGEVAVAAVRRLIELAREFESKGHRQLADFVRHLREKADGEIEDPGAEGGPDLAANLPTIQDAVQIGTIHSVKGLEFPIVVLLDIGSKAPHATQAALFSPKHGLGLRMGMALDGLKALADATHATAREWEEAAEAEERNRKLYVALTRAREYLILAGECGNSKDEHNWRKLVDAHRAAAPEEIREVAYTHAELTAAKPERSAAWIELGAKPALRSELAGTIADAVPASVTEVRPAALGRRDVRVTVTRLAAWLACPKRAALTEWLGDQTFKEMSRVHVSAEDAEETVADREPDAAQLGTAAHAALELMVADGLDVDAAWKVAALRGGLALNGAESKETLDCLRKVVSMPWMKAARTVPAAKRLTEKPFRWKVVVDAASGSTVTLVGTLDLIFAKPDGSWQVIDFKLASFDRESDSAIRYAWQALIYSRIAARILDVSAGLIEPALLFLKDPSPKPLTVSEMIGGGVAIDGGALESALEYFWRQTAADSPLVLPKETWTVGSVRPAARTRSLCESQHCPHLARCFLAR